MRRRIFEIFGIFFLITISHCIPLTTYEGAHNLKSDDSKSDDSKSDNRNSDSTATGSVFSPAPARVRATTVQQSVTNWIQDVDTVNKFLDVALTLPLGKPLQSAASKALAFAQDEPVNNKYLGAIPGLDAAGQAAAGVLDQVFGDVLVQLGNVVDKPASLSVAVKAVARINDNRCKNVLPSAETLWRSAATAMNMSTPTYPPKANRENACPGRN